MDATEYVGRRAERTLGSLPTVLVTAAAVCAVAGLVQLWRLTAPSLGLGAPAASGSLWQRVTMGIGNGYDVTPLAWGALAVAALAGLALASRPGLPAPGPRLRRTAVVVAGALLVLSVAAVVLVAVWALVSRGEVSFSFEAPGDQDGSRVTTQVGTYQTDVWAALVRVTPALVAAALSVGAAAALLRPAPALDPASPATPEDAEAAPVARPATSHPDRTDVEAWDDGVDTTPYDVPARDGGSGTDRADRAVRADRSGHRGSGGAERFARSLTPTGAPGSDGSGDPLAGWTVGPGASSDVAFRRPGSASSPAATAADGRDGHDGSTATTGADDVPSERPRDPYRRPGA